MYLQRWLGGKQVAAGRCSHKGLHRGSNSRRKKRRWGGGISARMRSWLFCLSRHGYRARWHPHGENGTGVWTRAGLGALCALNLTSYVSIQKCNNKKNQHTLKNVWVWQRERYWPTTPGPPLRPPRSPRPRRRSARPGCRLRSCRWLSLASASVSERRNKATQKRKKNVGIVDAATQCWLFCLSNTFGMSNYMNGQSSSGPFPKGSEDFLRQMCDLWAVKAENILSCVNKVCHLLT